MNIQYYIKLNGKRDFFCRYFFIRTYFLSLIEQPERHLTKNRRNTIAKNMCNGYKNVLKSPQQNFSIKDFIPFEGSKPNSAVKFRNQENYGSYKTVNRLNNCVSLSFALFRKIFFENLQKKDYLVLKKQNFCGNCTATIMYKNFQQ